MLEPRCEARFAHEPRHRIAPRLMPAAQHFHDRFASELRLVCDVNRTEAAESDLLAQYELAERSPDQRIGRGHRPMLTQRVAVPEGDTIHKIAAALAPRLVGK